jgi:hypothetical protein
MASRICISAHARLQQPIAETNPAMILLHLYYCSHSLIIVCGLMNEMETRIPVVCPSPELERRTKYAKRRTRSDNYYRRHASNTPFCTTQLLNYALLPFLNNIIQKLWSARFVMPIASCEGPRCIPSLSLYVPTTTRTVPSAGCSGKCTKTTNGSHAPRNVTASRPSSNRWSYVKATIIIGLITICPSTTTGRSLVACIPIIYTHVAKIVGFPRGTT